MSVWILAAATVLFVLLRYLVGRRAVDATGFLYVLAPAHAATFALRRWLAWSAGPVRHPNEAKDDLFAHASPARARRLEKRERVLRRRYRLERFHDASSCADYRENLYLLDLLDRHVADDISLACLEGKTSVRAIDVGSKDFRYAHALARWLGKAAIESERGRPRRQVSLTGIELDGHRVYDDLSSRKDHGETYAREVDSQGADDKVTYEVRDFLQHTERNVDVVFLFFPFVLEYALVRWGLPRSCFLPAKMFDHVFETLRPGGLVVVMNHTADERRRQIELLRDSGFEILKSVDARSELVDYARDVPERSMTIARRPGEAGVRARRDEGTTLASGL